MQAYSEAFLLTVSLLEAPDDELKRWASSLLKASLRLPSWLHLQDHDRHSSRTAAVGSRLGLRRPQEHLRSPKAHGHTQDDD